MTKREDRVSTAAVIGIMVGVGAGATLLMCIWGACWVMKNREAVAENPYAVPGAFGDAFAPVVGFLTSLALGAAIASVFMQRKELELQRDEMRDAREQWTAQATALKDANRLQERANDLTERAQHLEISRQMSDLDSAAADLIHWAKEQTQGTSTESRWVGVDAAQYWHEFWELHPNSRLLALYHPRILCDYADRRSLLQHMYTQVRESARDFSLGKTDNDQPKVEAG